MRKTMTGLAAAVAVMTVTAVPAMACGGYSCAPSCGGGLLTTLTSGCGGYGGGYAYAYGGGYGSYGYPSYNSGCCATAYAQPTQYYYVNQGPTYTGPGTWAPYPTYQERAVSGWSAYSQPYYYGYNGGPYANASHHYYDGARVSGPVVYRYQPRRYYHGGYRPAFRYGYRPAPRVVYARPAYHAPRFHAPRYHRHHAPILRRYN